MKNVLYISLLVVLIICSCTPNEQKHKDVPILKVAMENTNTSVYDIFNKMEIIPLETTSTSLIRYLTKIKQVGNRFYIFDRRTLTVFIFDSTTGKYISKIHRIGKGPGEYQLINDCIIDELNQRIELLSPYKAIYRYNFDGTFLEKIPLPSLPYSFQDILSFDDDHYIMTASVDKDMNLGNIMIVSKDTREIINSYWEFELLVDMFSTAPFWAYNDTVFFSISVSNEVYRTTHESAELAYIWDFGNNNVDDFRKSIPIGVTYENINEKQFELLKQVQSTEDLYLYSHKSENKQYYYAQINFNFKKTLYHIFYNKESKESYYFDKTTEGLNFRTEYITDDYLLGELKMNDLGDLLNSNLLDKENREKLEKYTDEDNPYLIKLFFKKD